MAVCERHSNETRVTCPDCGTPICPQCMVDTPVGVKCPSCAAPAPELLARQRAITIKAVGVGFALGLAGALAFHFVGFGFLLGILFGFVVAEVLRRYGSFGNLLAAGLVAAGTAWIGAALLAQLLLPGVGFLTGLQIHAFAGLVLAGVVWWRLR